MPASMTRRERIATIMRHETPDRVGAIESFWGDTIGSWVPQGYPEGEPTWKVFDHDMLRGGGANTTAFPGRSELIEETENWRVVKDGNGATMKNWKNRPGVPEHIDFDIVNGRVWREGYREAVRTFNPKRVNLKGAANTLKTARDNDLYCCFTTTEVFEIGKAYAGHIAMCMGMLEEPEWIHDMFDSLVEMIIGAFEVIFREVGLPDGMWIWGDIGFRDHPFVSLDTYREMVLPHNKRLNDYFKSKGLPIILHSCGFIEPLVPGFIETGIDVLQAMEVKAGCDLRRLKPLYGDRIGFCGNVDIRALETNDLEKVEAEVRTKVECAIEGGGPYIFHTDHSVPSSVRYETYRFALARALEYGRYP